MGDGGELVSVRAEERVAVVTLQRPDAMNAISGALAEELAAACRALAGDDGVWVVVLTGAGDRAFCVGADLKERARFSQEDFARNRGQIRELFAAVRELPQPAIASVFGAALGGGLELALSCDLIVAAEGTRLGLPEVRVGLVPGGGGTQLLVRRVGIARAKELTLTGRHLDAIEAERIGLVARVVPSDELADATRELAGELCASSPVAARAAKMAVDQALGLPLERGLEVEHEAWWKAVTSEDRAEGIAAFVERREPRWRNR